MESTVVCQTPAWVTKLPQETLLSIVRDLDALDIKSLMFTCRTFGRRLGQALVEADIKERTYNSLFWACSWGDAELAKACMDAGASPNVTFCHSLKHRTDKGWSLIQDEIGYESFKNPVFPSRFRRREWLADEDYACSPLILATKMNHIEVMKVLLGLCKSPPTAKKTEVADLVERRYKNRHERYCLLPPERRRWAAHHSVALSHVRTVEAAKVLLTPGKMNGKTHINTTGNLNVSPLTLLLLRAAHRSTPKNPKRKPYYENSTRRRARLTPSELDEADLEDLVKLFLNSGANPRQESATAEEDRHLFKIPLFAAIDTMRPKIIKLIIQNGPLDLDNPISDCSQALRLALGDSPYRAWFRKARGVHKDEKARRSQLLKLFLESGVSPNVAIGGATRPLSITIARNSSACFEALLEWNADAEFTDANNLTPLSQSLLAMSNQYFFTLLESGVDVNKPSFHDCGFTPLMFAAGDHIAASKFKRLLQEGSERGRTGQLAPGGRVFSTLQCLLAGFPPPTSVADKAPFSLHPLRMFGPDRSHPQHLDESFHAPSRKKNKLQSFIALSLDSSHFYTKEGRHAINWAIDNLFHDNLVWAIKLLAPHYASTKLPNDHENPLATFFSPARAQGYLRFGTLPRAYESLKVMLEYHFHTNEGVDLNIILQHVSKLETKAFDKHVGQGWHAVMATCDADEQCKSTLFRDIRMDNERNIHGQRIIRAGPSILISYPRPTKEWDSFRLQRIGQMMNLLLQNGASLYAQDADGKTPYEYALDSKSILLIDEKWRDFRWERQLSRKRD